MLDIIDLEKQTHIVRKSEALACRQRKLAVIVKDTVECFDPFRVQVTIKHDPVALLALATLILDNPPQNVGKEAVCPLARCGIERAIQRFFAEHFRLKHVCDAIALAVLETTERCEEDAPRTRLTNASVADEHDTM